MITFAPSPPLAPEPAPAAIAPTVIKPRKDAPPLELVAEPIARERAKSSKPRSPKRKATKSAEDAPQLELELEA